MESVGGKLMKEVEKMVMEIQKRKLSDSSAEANSPKRSRVNPEELDLPDNTPEWGMALAKCLCKKIDSIEDSFNNSLEYANTSATLALSEVGAMKILFKEQNAKIDNVVYQVGYLKAENKALKEKVNNLENQSRRDNFLVTGFREQRGETDFDCVQKVYQLCKNKLKIPQPILDRMRIVRGHRKGTFVPGKHRPIIIKMHYFPDKQFILSKAKELKDSGYFINEDFSAESESKRKELYPIIKAARKLPAYKDDTYIHVDKLIYKGKAYTTDSVSELPPEINPSSLATQSKENLYKFFSRSAKMSNFHKSPITVNGVQYVNNEQYYQESKSDFFGDEETSRLIMATSNPAKMYYYGQNVKGYDDDRWKRVCDKIMMTGLIEKFKIPKFKDELLKTGDKTIAECNGKDPYWGTSCYMSDPVSDDPTKWKGQNKLGKLLMELRESLKVHVV